MGFSIYFVLRDTRKDMEDMEDTEDMSLCIYYLTQNIIL